MTAIEDRLRKNFKKLKPLADKLKVEAFRLYDRDIPEYPFSIDLYNGQALIQDRREPMDFKGHRIYHLDELKAALKDILEVEVFFERERKPQRQQNDASLQYQKRADEAEFEVVRESQAQFYINLTDYLDTGLFLDHRKIRQLIYSQIEEGQKFLNLFSYTGTASVFAALKGARTTSVDLSRTYTEWAKKNFELNNLDVKAHQFVCTDALEFISGQATAYDLIFFDPPTFSNSKKMHGHWDVQAHHLNSLLKLKKFLTPQGTLIFSTNLRSFRIDEEIHKNFQVSNLSRSSLPFDFHDGKIRQVFALKL